MRYHRSERPDLSHTPQCTGVPKRLQETLSVVCRRYCVVRQLFSPPEVSAISQAFDRLLDGVSAICAEHRADISQQLREKWQPADATGNSLNRGRASAVASSGSNYALSPRPDLSAEQQREAVERPRPELLATHLISDCGKQEPVLAALGQDPRLLTLAADVLDQQALAHAGERSLYQLINQAHFKAPRDGVDFPWHQDSINRGYHTGAFADVHGNRSYVNIAVAVDAETEENGPLSVSIIQLPGLKSPLAVLKLPSPFQLPAAIQSIGFANSSH